MARPKRKKKSAATPGEGILAPFPSAVVAGPTVQELTDHDAQFLIQSLLVSTMEEHHERDPSADVMTADAFSMRELRIRLALVGMGELYAAAGSRCWPRPHAHRRLLLGLGKAAPRVSVGRPPGPCRQAPRGVAPCTLRLLLVPVHGGDELVRKLVEVVQGAQRDFLFLLVRIKQTELLLLRVVKPQATQPFVLVVV